MNTYICTRPKPPTVIVDVVHGPQKIHQRHRECHYERSGVTGTCGTNAQFFEPKKQRWFGSSA
jgi:hypothetical protein